VSTTAPKWRSGSCSDAGRIRSENEDRLYIDHERGIFLIADGVGGHVAGETAAELAIDVIRGELEQSTGELKHRIAYAIARANNGIFETAQANEALRGMACVLPLAVLDEDRFVVGHVGDSRLYLVWNGAIRKLTSDHSPVGEQEERGELTEREAMVHPRRNEVFRDVGTKPRSADDENFIEIREFLFKPDAAVLMCSDGLSDVLTSAQLNEIIEHYDGDPDQTARELVQAANQAAGSDNISVIFIAGPEFVGNASQAMAEARQRHAITRTRSSGLRKPVIVRVLTGRIAFLIYGLILGLLAALRWK